MLTIGSLFSGSGGLDLAVQDVLPTELAWYADVCRIGQGGQAGHHTPHRAPCSIMGHHHPGVPNLGDVTTVDCASIQTVDILTGGFPCPDVSVAGARKGLRDGTRSGLWSAMREAIAALRPRLVIIENVGGLLSASADSDMEQCPRCVGGHGGREPVLRALGRVLGDLADLRYDARWYGLRAADVGAAHARLRIFICAAPADPKGVRFEGARPTQAWRVGSEDRGAGAADVTLLPTPDAYAGSRGGTQHPDKRRAGRHSVGLGDVVEHLLPTPTSMDSRSSGGGYDGCDNVTLTDATVRQPERWGRYEAAIRRHEQALGRPAPPATTLGPKGKPRLSPRFVEWLMMLPDGWVTDTPGITHTQALTALGNGVVPPQAAAALRAYIEDESAIEVPA